MTNELRRIWSEDQHTLLGAESSTQNGFETAIYVGRAKCDDFLVYRKCLNRARVKLVQKVSLETDWFWDSASNTLVPDSLLASPAIISKTEHVLCGHRYRIDDVEIHAPGLEDLSCAVKIHEDALKTGALATWLQPRNPKRWIVSLHGGPESYEGLEIRYGGLYRELLRENIGVIILNYVGSTGLPKPTDGWRNSIQSDFSALVDLAKSRGYSKSDLSVMGASFGGALALFLHQMNELKHTIAISPLLDLDEQKSRGGTEYADWFKLTFNSQDEIDFTFEALTDIRQGTVSVTYGTDDKVLGVRIFSRLSEKAESNLRISALAEERGHVPVTYRATRTQLKNLRKLLVAL